MSWKKYANLTPIVLEESNSRVFFVDSVDTVINSLEAKIADLEKELRERKQIHDGEQREDRTKIAELKLENKQWHEQYKRYVDTTQNKIAELKAEIDSWTSLTDSAQATSIKSMAIRKSVAVELVKIIDHPDFIAEIGHGIEHIRRESERLFEVK